MGQDGSSPRQADDLEADPLAALAHLLGVEARQAKVAQTLDEPQDHGRLAAAGRARQQQVPRRFHHAASPRLFPACSHWLLRPGTAQRARRQ
jgi:hypothetical protein